MSGLQAIKSIGSEVLSESGRVMENFGREGLEEDDYSIPLEEYLYHAKLQREMEASPEYGKAAATIPLFELIRVKLLKKEPKNTSQGLSVDEVVEKDPSERELVHDLISEPLSTSKENANRMLRTASWGSVFYLITTDILGPTNAPYAISQLGYVPGSLLYFLFGICAAYTGFLLWNMYLKLDSVKYPLKTYGDIVGRIYGKSTRYLIDVLQAIQLFCNVAVIILGNGQGLSEVTKGKGCYTVLILVWALAGMIVGQIKSLQRFGFLATAAIWMNVFVIVATMVCVSKWDPDYTAAYGLSHVLKGPVVTKVVVSGSGGNFSNQLNACMNIVYAYGGALIFVELMAEMKRPWDFWKGMACAQGFIFCVYLVFGLIVYHYQGQFVVNPANQGIGNYGWQSATNVINFVSAIIAAGLYGNVGIKVVYQTICERFLRFPPLEGRKGRVIWFVAVVIFWGLAFVFAAAIPNFSSLVSLVGAVCILQFTYTFPFIMEFGLDFQIGALVGDGPYDHVNKVTNRIDTWKNPSRWIRAYKQKWLANTVHIILFLASLATAGLGIYSSAESLKEAFKDGRSTSFTCNSPAA